MPISYYWLSLVHHRWPLGQFCSCNATIFSSCHTLTINIHFASKSWWLECRFARLFSIINCNHSIIIKDGDVAINILFSMIFWSWPSGLSAWWFRRSYSTCNRWPTSTSYFWFFLLPFLCFLCCSWTIWSTRDIILLTISFAKSSPFRNFWTSALLCTIHVNTFTSFTGLLWTPGFFTKLRKRSHASVFGKLNWLRISHLWF